MQILKRNLVLWSNGRKTIYRSKRTFFSLHKQVITDWSSFCLQIHSKYLKKNVRSIDTRHS